MWTSQNRTKCAPAIVIGLSSVMLLLSAPNHRPGGISSILAKDRAGKIPSKREETPDKSVEQLASTVDVDKRERVLDAFGKLPVSFQANEGQFDSRVKFVSSVGGQTLFLTSTEALLTLSRRLPASHPKNPPSFATGDHQPPRIEEKAAVLRMKLVGASTSAKLIGLEELSGKSNYFIGSDPRKWRANVANYAKVKYEQIYPGLDLVYYGNARQLEYDLIVAPGADPGRIRLAFDGAERIHIDKDGDLVLGTTHGDLRQSKPVAYQETEGGRKEVAAHYVLRSGNHVGVTVPHYDSAKTLIIDPVLTYSTYLGGSDFDEGSGIAVDSSGSAYIVGHTQSLDYPVKNALQPALVGEAFRGEAFVTKLNPSGTALEYSTYLGGDDLDQATAVAVDAAGNAYLVGFTASLDFPIANAFQPARNGLSIDAFVTKLNAAGSALIYSTYLGGSSDDTGYAIAVDSSRSAYVSGATASSNFPTVDSLQPALSGSLDAFIAKFTPSGSALSYSTYLGGTGTENGRGISVDRENNAFVAGSTSSPDFPTVDAFQSDYKGRTAFKSVDQGSQWESINNGLPVTTSVLSLAIDHLVPSTVYAGTESGGLFKSTNSGNSWTETGLSISANAVAVDPNNSNAVFAATNAGVRRSTDGGSSWDTSTFDRSVAVAIAPSNPSIIYAGKPNGFWKSTNGGVTWLAGVIRDNGGLSAGTPSFFAIDPTAPSTVYAASSNNVVFKSVNGGATWSLASEGLFFGGYHCLAIDPNVPSTIYAGSTGAGVFRSIDGGQSWSRSLSGSIKVTALAVDSSSRVYAGSFGKNVFKSSDGGSSWVSPHGELGNSFIRALAASQSAVYAGGSYSADGFAVKVSPSGTSLLYSTYIGGVDLDHCTGIAIDGAGNAHLVGQTFSFDFPVANPAQAALGGFADAFAAKLSGSGVLMYATYLGGSGEENALGIAVDQLGNAYTTGFTYSTDFPLVNPLPEAQSDTNGNAFVTKINETGAGFGYSTYLGGARSVAFPGDDFGIAIAVDSGGSAYVTGYTFSALFPTAPAAFQPAIKGTPDAFVSKLSQFDVCLQDDSNSSLIQFNSTTGDYVFQDCSKGARLAGRGMVSVLGCKIELRDMGPQPKRPDRDVYALVNSCTRTGNGSVIILSTGRRFNIRDTSNADNTCLCAR